jgi:hypothetical protein
MGEYKIDRAGWPAGEWDTEADRYEWRSRELPCLILRNSMGGLCGYVGIPAGHPWHVQPSSDDLDSVVSVHGGITFMHRGCSENVCHVPQPGETEDLLWVGFDCCHAGDALPVRAMMERKYAAVRDALPYERFETYRNITYVRAEVESLVEQVMAAARTVH